MIEFNGLKIDTRSLVLISATLIAVVALWPEDGPDRDTKPVSESKNTQANRLDEGRTSQSRTNSPVQSQARAAWQDPLRPYHPTPSSGGAYSNTPQLPQGSAYAPQQPAYGNQRFPTSREPARRDERAPAYGYGTTGGSPYGYSNPYPGIRFRPKENARQAPSRGNVSGTPPVTPYSPVAPRDSQPPAYSPIEALPWEYSPYETAPYDVAPSGSTAGFDDLYSIR